MKERLFKPQTTQPKYMLIQETVLNNIYSGTWSPGDKIPTERALADFFQASVGTVRHALQGLVDQGFLSRLQGKGTFVNNSTEHTDSLRYYRFAETFDDDVSPLTIHCLAEPIVVYNPEAALKLGLEKDAELYKIDRLFLLEKKPVVFVTSYLPKSIFKGFEKIPISAHEEITLYLLIEQRYGIPTLSTREGISAVACGEEQAKMLEVPVNSPILKIRMLALTMRDLPYEYRESYCRTDELDILRTNAAPGVSNRGKFSRG